MANDFQPARTGTEAESPRLTSHGARIASKIFEEMGVVAPCTFSGGGDGKDVPPSAGASRLERIVRKETPEHMEYLKARFARGTGYSFEFDGHRWAYQYSSFDDAGEFDVLTRPAPRAEGPATKEPEPSYIEAVFRDGFYAGAEYQGWSDADQAGCDVQIGRALEEALEKRRCPSQGKAAT